MSSIAVKYNNLDIRACEGDYFCFQVELLIFTRPA